MMGSVQYLTGHYPAIVLYVFCVYLREREGGQRERSRHMVEFSLEIRSLLVHLLFPSVFTVIVYVFLNEFILTNSF